MKVIRKSELKRLGSELLCKDLLANAGFTCSNASFSGHGGESVIGTIESKRPHSESYIQYAIREKRWDSTKLEIIRYTEDTNFRTDDQEYSKKEDSQVIKTVYYLADDIYVEDEETSKNAQAVRRSRWGKDKKVSFKFALERDHEVKFGTSLYDKLYQEATVEKPIKYGSPISITVWKYRDRTTWKHDPSTGEYKKFCFDVIETSINCIYRKQNYSVSRPRIEYNFRKVDN